MKISGNYTQIPSRSLEKKQKSDNKNILNKTLSSFDMKIDSSFYQGYSNLSFKGVGLPKEIPSLNYIYCLREVNKKEEVIFSYIADDGSRIKSSLEHRLVDVLLRNTDYEVEKDNLDAYIGLYELGREHFLQEATETKLMLSEMIGEIDENDSVYGEGVLPFKTPEQKAMEKEIKDLIQKDNLLKEEIDMNASKYARVFLQVLKTKNGLDFSDFEQKKEIAHMLFKFEDSYNSLSVINAIIENSTNEDGKINYDFCKKLISLIQENSYLPRHNQVSFVSYSAELLNKIINSAEGNEDEVFDCCLNLISERNLIDPKERNFERAFSLCLNPITEKFDKVAYEKFIEINEELEDWLDEKLIDDGNYDYFPVYQTQKAFLLQQYMMEIKDRESGTIIPDCVSPQEFLEDKIY